MLFPLTEVFLVQNSCIRGLTWSQVQVPCNVVYWWNFSCLNPPGGSPSCRESILRTHLCEIWPNIFFNLRPSVHIKIGIWVLQRAVRSSQRASRRNLCLGTLCSLTCGLDALQPEERCMTLSALAGRWQTLWRYPQMDQSRLFKQP